MPADNKKFDRIDRMLAGLGYGSRKDIDIALKAGRITVQGMDDPRSEMRVDPGLVRVLGEELDNPDGLLIVLNKPLGVVCSHSETEGPSVYGLLPPRWAQRSPRLETIGRLDKDTSGLVLLTDQHELIHRLTSPKNHVPKVYEALVEGDLKEEMIGLLATGTLKLSGEDKPCLPAKLEILDKRRARLTLNEGKYHQVRRMLGAVGAPVLKLHRVKFGNLDLGDLPESEHRILKPLFETIA